MRTRNADIRRGNYATADIIFGFFSVNKANMFSTKTDLRD